MANPLDLLAQAAQSSQMLPDASADAAEWTPAPMPEGMMRNEEIPDEEFQKYMASIVPAPVQEWTPPVLSKMQALSWSQPSKQEQVANAAEAKKRAMAPADYFANAVGMITGKGYDSASEVERDLRELPPSAITAKYGDQDGGRLLADQAAGAVDLIKAQTRGQRDGVELWDDLNVTLGQAFGSGLASVAAIPVAIASDIGGTYAAQKISQFNKFMEENQSPRLQARQDIKKAKDTLDNRDSAAQAVKDAAEDGEVVAGLKKIGREWRNSLSNATDDPATFGAGVTNALGSFLAAGPVAKGLSALSKGALGTTSAIAATEAGGVYVQSADQIMGRTHEQLMEGSQYYRTLIEQGSSQEDAKRATANSVGLTAAAITAPVAAAAGRLVHRFEGNVGALGSGRQLAGNVARETTEESIQSGFGQFAQNVATQQIADDKQALTEGVGQQIAEGGLYGMGMTVALGSPAIAGDVAKAGGRAVATAFNDRLARIDEANKASSPVSDETVAQAAAEAQASAPAAEQVLREAVASAPAEQQEAGNAYVDQLLAASQFSPDEAPAAFNGLFDDVTTRTGAIQRMAEIVNSAEEGSNDQLRAGFALYDLVNDYAATINQDPDALSALPADNQAAQIVAQYQGLMGAIQNSPKVAGAIDKVMSLLEASEAKQVDVTAESVATPEGQQDVADVLSTAELAPEKVDLGTAEKILYQIQQGNLTVTPRQKAALDSSVAILRAVQEADKAAVAAGQSDPVSLNISSVDGEKGKSLTQHAKGIMSAWKAGDRDLAADRLVDLKNFAQGMSNKVGALNAHFAAGKPNAEGLNYEVFVGGEAVPSKAKVATRTGSQGGIQFAQKVAREAKLLADVYNGLATAFPDLGAEHLAVTPLASELVGKPAEVVARLKPQAAPVAEEKDTPAPQAAPAPKKESAPAAKPVAPVADKKQAPVPKVAEPVVEEAPVVAEPTPALKGTAAAFPQLIGGESNYFNRSFKLPKEQRTRTMGTEAPVATVRAALKDSASLTAAIGSFKGKYTPEIAKAYDGYLAVAEDFVSELDDTLQQYLDSPYSSTNPTTHREVLNGVEVRTGEGDLFEPVRSLRGRSLAITERDGDDVVYNPELAQSAVLAGLQWFLTSDNYASEQDTTDIAKLLGMEEASVSDEIVQALNQGLSVTEAKRSLATKIRQYWGVQNEADAGIGYQEGIPEAVAAEVLRAFVKGGWLTEELVKLTEADGLPPLPSGKPNIQEYIQLVPSEIPADSPLRAFPSAIEQAVLIESQEMNYIGEGSLPPVAKDQLRNPGVENTAQQLDMIEKEQATPYNVNTHMAGFYMALGRDLVLDLFGAGEVDPKTTNVNHAQSMEGVNRSVVAAFDHLQGLLAEVDNVGDLATTPIHYQFNMTRVARLQMLGKHNPQSNKLVREAILPTWSTLDLSGQTGQDYKRFMLAVGQMLGVKVHKMSQSRSRAATEAMLTGPLAPAVEALANFSKGFRDSDVLTPSASLDNATVEILKAAFKASGEALTPMALHAVMDYARYQNAEDKSAFRTAVYVEADGVTNGPINAMVLFTTGLFKGNWIKNIAKGGLFFNRPGETVNTNNESGDSRDLYQATTDSLDGKLNNLRKVLRDDAKGTQQMDAMLRLMDLFYGKDLTFREEGGEPAKLELTRGIAKNPLTITIYGSGAGGIAAKMTKMLTDAMYERMSQVAQARADGETSIALAMFGPQSVSVEDANAKYERFVDSFSKLVNTQAGVKKDGSLFFKSNPSKDPKKSFDPVKFTLTAHDIGNIQSNVRYLFVDPMRDAIRDTVGGELLDTAEMLRMATQAQSIVLEHAFKAEVDALLAQKAEDPSWKKTDFLTRRELDGIRKKLEHLSPLVQTEHQNFFIAGSETADVKASQFSRSLNNRFRSPAFVAGPTDAGVSGIPFLNIGSGDGQMMQNISVAPNAPTGTLKIFDGMNMPLDQIESGSEVANKAVMDSWMGNPLAAVHKSFSQLVSDAKLTDLSKEAREALSEALFGLGDKSHTENEIVDAMTSLVSNLDTAQQFIEARHRVMSRVAVSVDQMAAVGMPYTQNGDLPLVGTDPDAIAEQLNVYLMAELASMQGDKPSHTMTADIAGVAQAHETGVSIMPGADLPQLKTVFTAEQKAVLDVVVDSLAAQDYTIVFGNAQQIADYQADRGLPGATASPTGEVFGYTNPGDKTIYLISPSTETFMHELVHAATFEAVNAHYTGVTTKPVADAVGRLETMMEDFLTSGAELTQTSQSVNSAFNNVSAAIQGHLSADRPAEALNEFMAWTLTNESLVRVAQRQQVSKLARIKDKVVSAIKSLLGIKESAGRDLFSNLLFNSSIIAHSQPQLAERFAAGSLFMNSNYGADQRLADVNDTFNKAIGRYLQEAPTARNIDQQSAFMTGIQNAYRVAESFMNNGFNMTAQEATTFNTIVTALSTEATLDPNSMAAVQQLYSHVMKQLSPESFMADPNSTQPGVYEAAAKKFDVLSGKFLVTRDLAGRSSLLPAFLALATTNNEFRSVLENLDLPKTAANKAGTLDALLENMGNNMMDRLGQRMTGTKKAKNVQEAIDLLNAHMAKVINDRETLIDQSFSKAGGVIDRANDLVKDGMERLAGVAMKFAKRTQRNAAGRLERTAGGIVAGFAALIDEQTAKGVSQATMAAINKTKLWDSVHTLINDVVGRTDSNASVYDMIKVVRAVIQRIRQQYRENLPELLASKFSRELTKEEKASLHRSMAKTDLAALGKDALQLAANPEAAIPALEQGLSAKHIEKAKQLANYMLTGVPGKNLLRNPEAVARLLGEGQKVSNLPDVGKLDRLITLYALRGLGQADKDTLASLVQDEATGMQFSLDYLTGQRAEEKRKATGRAKFNYFKGYVPEIRNEGVSMLVAHDSEHAKLLAKSYTRVGDYNGSPLERGLKRSYFFIPVSARATFEQGIMQNVQQTAGGVDASTGFTLAQTAGRITDAADVKLLARRMPRDGGREALLPVYNEAGDVVAFERALDSDVMSRLLADQDLHKSIGQWRGRQVEEGYSQVFNEALIGRLKDMYDRDLAENPDNARQYVDLLNTSDPVWKDAVSLMNHETRALVEGAFGDKFMVRRDMITDAVGYRAASVGDVWTGNTRWSDGTRKAVRNVATAVFGNDAYKAMLTAEKTIQSVVADAKTLIVVKSVIVPMSNLMSNVYQLIARGVPIRNALKAFPAKAAEVEAYTKSLVRRIEAEAELRAAAGDPRVERRLKTEIQAINDSHRRMSIWPLIEAGEFSGIADAGITRGEIPLTSGRLQAYMEQAASKLPGWGSTIGRYALVTKDTALFQGLQKAVEYGDFLAKAAYYDDLTQRKGLTQKEALALVTEEFVNYDRLAGRFRGTMENLGLLWFYNFKIRSVKIAASMIRNNPVHALLAGMAPAPEFFGTVGLPIEDNMITKMFDGTLDYSMGPGQGLRSMMMNPWINLTQ